MAKEYDHEQITPENVEDKTQEYLRDNPVGSVEFMAFNDALEWRMASNNLQEYRQVMKIIKRRGGIPEDLKDLYEDQDNVESHLRMAETRFVLANSLSHRLDGVVPGYTNASLYSFELIQKLEERQEYDSHQKDPVLKELRRKAEAHDYLMEELFESKIAPSNTVGQAALGLIRNII